MNPENRIGPVVASGMFVGFGIGGLIEAVVFRQILGAHSFLSARGPIKSVADLRSGFVGEGLLNFVLILCIVSGLIALFNAAKRTEVFWSGQVLFGSLFLGWGAFTLIEGLVSHLLLKLHHLLEYANPASQETGDYAYLIVGALLAILGYWAVKSSKSEMEEQARAATRATQRAKEIKGDRKVYLD